MDAPKFSKTASKSTARYYESNPKLRFVILYTSFQRKKVEKFKIFVRR
jgi:hypothetical protein